MIVKSQLFDEYVAKVKERETPPLPTVARSFRVKGYSLHLETTLAEESKALRIMSRMEAPSVRFFYPNYPAKRITGPLCLVSMLHHGRMVELFCAEVHGGLVVLAIYSNDALAAYQLVDQLINATK